MLCDGARGIWKYVDPNPQFDEYEKLLDLYHASEHLSKAAEALLGKASLEAKKWYESWYDMLIKEEGACDTIPRVLPAGVYRGCVFECLCGGGGVEVYF